MKRVEVKIASEVGLEPQDIDLVVDLVSDAGRFNERVVQVNISRTGTSSPSLVDQLKTAVGNKLRQLGKEPVFNVS